MPKMSSFVPTDLIREVKIRPGIYNKDALPTPRKDTRQQLWMEVAEKLTPTDEWESYTEEDKEIRVAQVNNKWKNLRDHFYREVKLLESGETNKKRKYVYYDAMAFVRPYIGYKQPPLNKRPKRSFSTTEDNSQETRYDNSDIDMDEFLKSKTKVEGNQNTRRELRYKITPSIKNTSKIRPNKQYSSSTSANNSQKEVIIEDFNILGKTYENKSPSFKIRESDLSFCLSLVPTLRQMSEVRKLGAKIDILKILHKNMAQFECGEPESIARPYKIKENQNSDCDELVEECEESLGDNKIWW